MKMKTIQYNQRKTGWMLLSFLLILTLFFVNSYAETVGYTEISREELFDEIPEYFGMPYIDLHEDVPYFQESMTTAFYGYGPLDELGRCTIAFACIGTETMPTEPRENISSIHPSGWSDVKYEGIDGGNLFNRCHLIGYQLTGQNVNERNIITGTRYMNVEGMLPFENSVAEYVRTTGNHVMYRVTPVYDGDDLVAAGVLMEARSVEDPLVQFCVFCYNVQPGIEIDYTTGESYGEGRINEDVEDIQGEDGSLSLRYVEPATSDAAVSNEYVLNTNTKKFHYPSCDSVSDMKEKNKQIYNGNREELIGMGYEPCGRCNP